jgi:hypothetical protein
MTFPREEKQDLCLLQQYIVFQICIQSSVGFGLELIVSDSTKVPAFIDSDQKTHNLFPYGR